MNYVPPYQDECFCYKAISMFKHQLEQIDYKNQTFHGAVALQLGNTLWLNDVYEEKVLSDKSVVPGFQLARQAVKMQLAEYDKEQFKRLHKLCDLASISVSISIPQQKMARKKKTKTLLQWAYLDVDQPNEVIFCSAISPGEFYVRLHKFNDL